MINGRVGNAYLKNSFINLSKHSEQIIYSQNEVAGEYFDNFKGIFPNFPNQPGDIDNSSSPATGIYVLPDNVNTGVLETI